MLYEDARKLLMELVNSKAEYEVKLKQAKAAKAAKSNAETAKPALVEGSSPSATGLIMPLCYNDII